MTRGRPAVSGTGSWRLFALALLVLAGLVVAAHAPVLRCDALSADDDEFITNNRLVTNPSVSSARAFFVEVLNPSTVAGYYLPVTMTSLMLDYAAGGRTEHPVVFHRTNLALHVGVTLLLAVLFFRLFGAALPAVLAASLFGLHPLTVEPVAWLSERKTLLATLFALVSVIGYVESARRASRAWRAASLVSFALALLSKPSVTTLPVLLLLLDVWPLRRSSRRTALATWPWFALAAASSLVATMSLKNTESFTGTSPSGLGVVLRMLYLPVFYLTKALHPVRLSILYPPPEPWSLAHPIVLAHVVGLVVLTTLLYASRRRWPGAWTGWTFFLVALVPTFGILVWSRVIAWDRYAYLPIVGPTLALAWLLERLWRSPSLARRTAIATCVLVLAALEARGVRAALAPWRDSVTLWRHAVASAPNEPWAHNGLGVALGREPAPDDSAAAREFEAALALSPTFTSSLTNLAAARIEEHRFDEANALLRRAEAILPRSAGVAYQLGWSAHEAGQLDRAASHYDRALALQPAHLEARVELGIVRIQQGRADEGIALLREAVARSPVHPGAQLSLAMALLQSGHDEEAITHLEDAVRRKKDWQAPMNTLAWLRATHPDPKLRDGAEALRLAKRVVALTEGKEAAAFATQAAAEATTGDFAAARATATKALTMATSAGDDSLAARVRTQQARYARDEIYTEPVRANY